LTTQYELEPVAWASEADVLSGTSNEFWSGCVTGTCGETGVVDARRHPRGEHGNASVNVSLDGFLASCVDEVECEDQNHSTNTV
jgi:hypothetical protein